MKWLNEYFFGEEQITWSDGLWFYGAISFVILVAVFTLIFS